jgi:hypothetical protein
MALPYALPGDPLASIDDRLQGLALKLDGGANGSIAPGASMSGGGVTRRRSGIVVVSLDCTATGAIAGSAVIATVSEVSHRPLAAVYGVVVNLTTGSPLTVVVQTSGAVQTLVAVASGTRFIGNLVAPAVP